MFVFSYGTDTALVHRPLTYLNALLGNWLPFGTLSWRRLINPNIGYYIIPREYPLALNQLVADPLE